MLITVFKTVPKANDFFLILVFRARLTFRYPKRPMCTFTIQDRKIKAKTNKT